MRALRSRQDMECSPSWSELANISLNLYNVNDLKLDEKSIPATGVASKIALKRR